MLFNVDKCKMMDFNRSNGKPINTELVTGESGGSSILKFAETEKDLGVTLSRNMKFSTHIRIQTKKATAILGQLKRTFKFWTIATCRTLYCAFVRPHLEYAAAVWFPYSKKDIKILETVQCRASKLVRSYRN